MNYYLIYLKSGVIVDVSCYDNEVTRDKLYRQWVYRDQNRYNDYRYDDVQCIDTLR